MTKSRVNSNPEIPPNPTSNHQPAPLRSYSIIIIMIIIVIMFLSRLWECLHKNKSKKKSELNHLLFNYSECVQENTYVIVFPFLLI